MKLNYKKLRKFKIRTALKQVFSSWINLTTFLLIFFIMLLAASLIFYYTVFAVKYYDYTQDYKSYIQKEKNDIEKIFLQVFPKALDCKNEENCLRETKAQIAELIKEESFKHKPDSLFFVKKINNEYYLLGWEGKIINISDRLKHKKLKKQSSFFDYEQNNCNYFGRKDLYENSCEFYVQFDLKDTKAYVAGLMPRYYLGKLDLLFMILFLPFYFLVDLFLVLKALISQDFSTLISISEGLTLSALSLLILFSILLTSLFVFSLIKKLSEKHN